MRTTIPIIFSLLTLVVLSTGCSGAMSSSQQGVYTENLGTTTRPDVEREAPEVLASRYGYRFDRRVETDEDIRYITQWTEHTPLEDEEVQGVTSVRTRLFVTARPKNRTANTYRARFRAECEVQKEGSPEWVTAELTEMRRDYIEEIADYLGNQLTSGVRSR